MKGLDNIIYQATPPCKELRDFVSHFWHSKWLDEAPDYFSYHSTASTNTEFVFAFAPDGMKIKEPVFSSVQGHSDIYRRIETGGFSEMFGVALYSHAIPFFFGFSATDLKNQLLDFNDIIKQDITALKKRLAYCHNFNERVEVMTHYLKKKFSENQNSDLVILNAIKKMRKMRGQVNILDLANDFFLSQKQFERRFKNFSGFNPKLYSRILRFESSFCQNDLSNFTKLALDLGYYDQAHFINDFRKFSGFSPCKYTPIS